MKSTNYFSTFIEVADDCPVTEAEVQKEKGDNKTVPLLHYELIFENPYKYTQDDIIFTVYAIRNNFDPDDQEERQKFFSKGQPCLRSSSLGKRYGWGVHCDENGKVAVYPMESPEYQKFLNDDKIKKITAMRTKRVK